MLRLPDIHRTNFRRTRLRRNIVALFGLELEVDMTDDYKNSTATSAPITKRVGFTGTRRGMSDAQGFTFWNFLMAIPGPIELHHGDCVGADDEAASTVAGFTYGNGIKARIVCHPPVDSSHRANNPHATETRAPKTHFARNRDIVDETEMLIATPWQSEIPPKGTGGGTWQTIAHALKTGKPVTIIWPDGRVEKLEKPCKS